jgi:CRP-like cAMP-binding protein
MEKVEKRTYSIAKDEPLFTQGEVCVGAWILMSGTVARFMGFDRRPLITQYANEGALLGLAETLSNDHKFRWSAIAATNITVHFIAAGDIVELIKDDGATAMELVLSLVNDLQVLHEQLRHVREALHR